MLPKPINQWDIIEEIFHLFTANPWSFFLIPLLWISMIIALDKIADIRVTAWSVLMSLVVAVGIVIGILLLL